MSFKIRLLTLIIAVSSLLTTGAAFAPSLVSALSGFEFKSGRIIDDGVFFNPSTMTVAEIQQFLNSKVPTCDTNGSQIYSGSTTRAQYGASVGNPAPYTCLKDYSQSTTSRAAEAGLCNAYTGGTYSSAQIIYDVSQACGINPKVLIVLLQKEQALVTDDWPWPSQYRSATGFGCPDTAPCDSQYYGFFNQVYNAARIYKYYAKNAAQYNYTAYRNNNIQFNPNNTCGSSSVYIENQATAGLYTYTPYQPNSAALANLYGSGDSCSAYGNRNFWRLFIDWFGSVNAAPYVANYFSQSAYPQLNSGQSSDAYLMYQNRGSSFWYDDSSLSTAPAGTQPVHLAASRPINRCSNFSVTWTSCNRPANTFSAVYESDGTTLAADQHVARPGQVVKFGFKISVTANYNAGSYNEYFQPILEGSPDGAFPETNTYLTVNVNPVPSVSWVEQSPYPTITPDSNSDAFIKVSNSGNTPLYDNLAIASAPSNTYPLHLATSGPINRCSNFGSTWASCNRPANTFASVYESDGTTLASNQHVAQPGQVVKFAFKFSVPAGYSAGSNTEYFQPILEGSPNGGLPDLGINLVLTVPSTAVVNYAQLPLDTTFTANEPKQLSFQIKNTGNSTLAGTTQIFSDNGSGFKSSTWPTSNTIGTLGSDVAAGQTRTVNLPLVAPADVITNSPFNISFKDSNSGNVIPGSLKSPKMTVTPSVYKASYVAQTNYPSLTVDQINIVSFSYKNLGNQPWYDDTSFAVAAWRNPHPYHLATAQTLNRCSGFAYGWPSCNRPANNFNAVYESDGITLAANQHISQPGQIVKYSFQVKPAGWVSPGTYREYFQPIAEGTSDGLLNFVGTYQDITNIKPINEATYFSEATTPSVNRGSAKSIYFDMKNSGNVNWYDDTSVPSYRKPVHLAASAPINRSSVFAGDWPTTNRPVSNFSAVYESDGITPTNNQHVVLPGQIAHFQFNVIAPNTLAPGEYKEYFQPILEGAPNYEWSMQGIIWVQINVL